MLSAPAAPGFARRAASAPDVAAIVVSHRSAAEAVACVASLREELARDAIRGEVILVDCASGDAEAAVLRRAAADDLLLLPENRGYSGGINAGLARARAPRLLLCNADLVFGPGSLSRLLAALERPGTGAAGPLCHWDAAGRIRMPPGYAPAFWRDFFQLAAGRFPAIDRRRFAAAAREAGRLWREGGETAHLTGAVLAVRRETFDRAGRFDERFPLEYEESEWEERVRAAGLVLRYEPAARVRHLYARSSTRSAEAPARREASRDLYRLRRYGRLGAAALAAPRLPRRDGASVAISPNPSLLPFAGASLDADFELPADVLASLPPGPLYLRVFRDRDGEPLETYVWSRP